MKRRFFTQLTAITIFAAAFALFWLWPIQKSIASNQGQTITLTILEFQDEQEAGAGSAVISGIANKLAQKLNDAHKDVLARRSNLATNSAAIQAMTVEQLRTLGKQQGVQFMVRGGLLPSGDSQSIQLYVDIISVEDFTTKPARASGDGADKNQALSNALDQLAELVYQAVSPTSEATPPTESSQEPGASAQSNSSTDATTEVAAAEADEELQQLIAQAESLVADGTSVSGERLITLNEALETLRTALRTKATLLEEGKDSISIDEVIANQKALLQESLSSIAEREMLGASTTPDEQDQQSNGEKKSLLSRINEFAGETLSIIQKIQEIRGALRSASAEQTGDAGLEPTEESTEEISGVVTEMGEPLAGIIVTELESGASAETDSNGAYVLEGVPAGRMAKLVLVKGNKQKAMSHVDLPRGRAAVADFDLKSQTGGAFKSALRIIPATVRLARAKEDNRGALKGVVRDAQGRPVGRALVRLGRALARTDTAGHYVFLNVRPGAHEIVVHRPGSEPRAEMVQVAAQKTSELKIQLDPGEKTANARTRQPLIARGQGNMLRGVVLDLQQRPLTGAKVTVVQQASAVSVRVGLRGDYLLRDLKAGSYRVLVSKAGYVSTALTVTLKAGESKPHNFQLKKTDSAFIERALARRRNNQTRSTAVKTDQGIFRPEKVTNAKVPIPSPTPTQRTRAVNATVPIAINDKRIAPAVSRLPTKAVEIRKGRLSGHVVDAKTGRPVSGALVSLSGRRTVLSDRNGSYAFDALAPGAYQVTVRKTEFLDVSTSLVLRPGETMTANLRLNPKPPARIR